MTLNKAPEILNETFLRDKELEKKKKKWIDKIKEEYTFFEILESLQKSEIPDSIEFYFGGENEKFFIKCKLLNLSVENENFVDFLSNDYCSNIMRENKLLIHIESGNVYFDNFNTNESIYDFLLWKQDFEKKLTNGDFSYGGVFSRYVNEFLSGIDSEADNRFDLLTKKDAKYLFYCFSDYLQSWNIKKNKNNRYKYLKILLCLKKFKKGIGSTCLRP